MQTQITNLAYTANKLVREAFSEINDEIVKDNEENGCEEPLIETDKVVMYTARHSLANHLLNISGVSVRELASILSRSPNTISVYIHSLLKNYDIVNITNKLPV